MQPSPYMQQPIEGNSFQQAIEMQRADQVYRYQKHGFQPLKQDVNQMLPSAYDNSRLVGRLHQITGAKTSSVSSKPVRPQHSPITTQSPTTYNQHGTRHLRPVMMSSPKTDLYFQENGISDQHWIKQSDHNVTLNHPRESTQRIENTTVQAIVGTNDKQLTPRLDVQLLVDKNKGSTSQEFNRHDQPEVNVAEIPQLLAQDKVKLKETETVTDSAITSSPETEVKEAASVQAEENVPDEPNKGMNEESKYQVSMVNTTLVIPNADVMPAKSTEAGLLTPNSPPGEHNWYNQYRPSTPVAPEISEKVAYFEGKIEESTTKVNFILTVSLWYITSSSLGSIPPHPLTHIYTPKLIRLYNNLISCKYLVQ